MDLRAGFDNPPDLPCSVSVGLSLPGLLKEGESGWEASSVGFEGSSEEE